MKITTGTVVGGHVEVPEEFATEGSQVVLLAHESGEPVRLSLAEEKELWEAMEEIRRGEYVDGDLEIIKANSVEFNEEAADVFEYQVIP